MPPKRPGIKMGISLWPQHTEWQPFLETAIRADQLGYASIWTWDHLYPIIGYDDRGPIFEGWMSIAAWAQATKNAAIGVHVSCNNFRHPALVAKMATTLDHISGGRAYLGIGAGWMELEHLAYGFEFGGSVGERLDWLDEGARIIRGMLDGTRPSGDRFYTSRKVRNLPAPKGRLPLMIGGNGLSRTMRLVARYGDACSVGGPPDAVRKADESIRRHCEAIGRDPDEIERTLLGQSVCIRDDVDEAHRVLDAHYSANGGARSTRIDYVGTPEMLADRLRPYVELGFRHLVMALPSPFDTESLERLVRDVKPLLEQV